MSKIVPLKVLPITMTSRTETEKYDSSTMCHSAHVTMHIFNVSWIFTKVVISTTTLTKQIKNIWITKSSDKRRFLISQLPTTYEAWKRQICHRIHNMYQTPQTHCGHAQTCVGYAHMACLLFYFISFSYWTRGNTSQTRAPLNTFAF